MGDLTSHSRFSESINEYLDVINDDAPSEKSLPLPFQKEMVTEIISEDSVLTVIAPGLGMRSILRYFASIFAQPKCFVLVIDARNNGTPEGRWINKEWTKGKGFDKSKSPNLHILSGETLSDQR
jgi:hypothetical protein